MMGSSHSQLARKLARFGFGLGIGLLVGGDDEFQFSRDQTSLHRVRIAVSTLPSHAVLRDALIRLRRLLVAGPSGHDSYT